MAAYVVIEPPGRANEPVFVRDGFAWLGFLFPPLWLLWNRLWIEAGFAVLAAMAIAAASQAFGLGPFSSALSLLVSLYVGLEGRALLVAARLRRGWQERGVVEAADAEEAEARYLIEAEETGLAEYIPAATVPPTATASSAMMAPVAAPALGLVPFSRKF